MQTPQEKRHEQITSRLVSSKAMLDKWIVDLNRFQLSVDSGIELSREDKRRFQFLKAFLLVTIDSRN